MKEDLTDRNELVSTINQMLHVAAELLKKKTFTQEDYRKLKVMKHMAPILTRAVSKAKREQRKQMKQIFSSNKKREMMNDFFINYIMKGGV